jgi:hypothetical protein
MRAAGRHRVATAMAGAFGVATTSDRCIELLRPRSVLLRGACHRLCGEAAGVV